MTDTKTAELAAERALVGIVLERPKRLQDVDVSPGDFGDVRLEAVWGIMLWLDANRMPADSVTVFQNIARTEVRGIDGPFLADLLHDAPISQLAHHYASMVVENATRRRLVSAGQRIQHLATSGEDSQEVVEQARKELDASSRAVASVTVIGDEIGGAMDEWESEAPPRVPTPWATLNDLVGGWRPGALYVVGARPAVGKSIFALQAAVELSRHGYVAFHSLEMPRIEVIQRVVSQMGTINQSTFSERPISPDNWDKIARVRAEVDKLGLSIDDRSSIRPIDVRSYARSLSRKGPIAGIFVDYLQLMSTPSNGVQSRQEAVAEFSRSLKVLAMELKVPVIVLSQLNRGSTQRADKRPEMSDLRESGAIEQDADVVMLLHVDEEKDPSAMEILVAKNRHGSAGLLSLRREGAYARLSEPQWRPAPQA